MRLKIEHITRYDYEEPVNYALQQLRLTPKSMASQTILGWETQVSGGKRELWFEDSHRNRVDLISFEPGTDVIEVRCSGEVEMTETHGVIGAHGGFMPLWMFLRSTPLTRAGNGVRHLAAQIGDVAGELDRLHALNTAVHNALNFQPGQSLVTWTAEDALAAGTGVCQDMAHVFISACRALKIPARYCSGYLFMEDNSEQDAAHAWAEAHVEGLGWVGFDPANDQCPDTRYVRVATGLDYGEAAPVSGMRHGAGGERLTVHVEVQQQ
ncbi:transglutaminase family protein [Pseudoroseicyclus tamaricis]|uniref:Transglutaminase family protein n=1 Tax=Pseudoroseicyclus tamaricis TaxID=2705421 RepID=A0A6B2JZF3_9RHOB|nr:transglutaminase family protein [Pseudoroseicyclus tamaricis]NDV00752.1 transglutaminase family protein [Pseudoroseicyclus tamaricis]